MSNSIQFPWVSHPELFTDVDWSNPLSNGLSFLTYGRWMVPVAPVGTTLTKQNPAFQVGPKGVGGAYNGSNVSLKLDKAPSGSSPSAVTMFAYASVVNTSNDYTVLSQADNAANPLFRIYSATAGQWTFQVRDSAGTGTFSISGGAPTANKDVFLVAVYRSGTDEKSFWSDGIKKGTSTTSIGAITLTRASVGQLYRNTEAQYLNGRCPFAGIINRALSDSEVSQLSNNPRQLLRPLQRVIFPNPVSAPSTFNPAWAVQSTTILGAGFHA